MNMFKKFLSFILCICLGALSVCCFSLKSNAAEPFEELKSLILNTDFSQYFNDAGSNILTDQMMSNDEYQQKYLSLCTAEKVDLSGNVYSLHDTDFKGDCSKYTVVNGIITNIDVWRLGPTKSYKLKNATPTVETNPASHEHDWIEGEIYAATQDKDGLGGVYCKTCGAVQSSYPISAYGYSINDYATPMVNESKAGQTTTFEFGEWNSFPKAFMEKIAAKSLEGVSFVFHYKWNHEKQEITIPYGTIVDTSLDWYGPAKMAELYGAN